MSQSSVSPNLSEPVASGVGFRINGIHFSLTYPRSDFSLEEGLEALKTIRVGSTYVRSVIIASEEHQGGGYHRHAYVRFHKRVDIRNSRVFDILTRHANVQSTRNVQAWLNYIKKDGEWMEWNDDVPESAANTSFNLLDSAQSMSRATFMQAAFDAKVPYAYAMDAWKTAHSQASTVTIEADPVPELEITLPPELEHYEFEVNRTNVIIGPSGCGKTVTAIRRMTKPILLCRHMDTLQHFDHLIHKSILFDDMAFTHYHRTQQIHICDRALPSALHRRYGTTLVPPGTQVTITGNEVPLNVGDPAIARRCKILYIPGWDAVTTIQ